MYDNEEHQETYRGYEIYFGQEMDMEPFDTRDNDNLGRMICFHNRYDLGDKKTEWYEQNAEYFKDFISGDMKNDPEEYPCDIPEVAVALPLYLYDHSGITMNCGGFSHIDSARWDWGCVGFIYITKDKVLKEFGRKRLTKKLLKRAEEYLAGEVHAYAQYLEGDIAYWRTEAPADEEGGLGETVDLMGGYYGFWESRKEMLEDAKASIDAEIRHLERQKWEALAEQEVQR
jgi:hypothetical protein